MTSTLREQWWLEKIDGFGFVLIHSSRGRDVACRISTEPSGELRTRIAAEICELRELINQSVLWVTGKEPCIDKNGNILINL